MKKTIETILKENTLCVLCTEKDGRPYCSLMTYILGEDMETLFMVAFVDSKKYKNIAHNKYVSVLVDNRHIRGKESNTGIVSITFEGIAQTLKPEFAIEIKSRLAEAHPELGEIANDSASVVLGIRLVNYKLLEGPVQSEQGDI
ncbi:MAG: hypothetical protein CVU86_01265 [Firmicutes bacterium HGW-Firmicutes-11]|jgi:nitroimidazol reductase NimA-like FMN-containing flavoprotein (pyridoxamine 5'-phosphate oxidase superfamily)|nr:MAG: hypothetical protein CVU86_01265 [Firmicutes bacterium HGW-Firmicutes-11]